MSELPPGQVLVTIRSVNVKPPRSPEFQRFELLEGSSDSQTVLAYFNANSDSTQDEFNGGMLSLVQAAYRFLEMDVE